ncbi:hypothetical protein K469DRAFT_795206 [Zopfia rhizophila CBS 207.26]|uniref:BHLH domain-containing protein n=1 Tax=Zopfia rhizophila CBS 207.26 TaxID=1314779 RepID=A0A6A6ES92_9PEZI|nr:hypothetical protein K469DRAFT_795206 [Zopfia rhizophila CBS 207.26]
MTVDWALFTHLDPLVDAGQACPSSHYSPVNEEFFYPDAFDRGYIADSYTIRPDYSLDDWVDIDFFDQTLNNVELPASLAPKNHAVFNATSPAAASAATNSNMSQWPTVNPEPFGRLGNCNDAFTSDLPFGAINSDSFESSSSSPQGSSPTLPPCGDCPQQVPASPASSHSSLKRESTDDGVEDEPALKRVQRKRGRPRINRSETDATNYQTGNSPKSRPSRRLPHNQVERKYREGLNSELERLRRAVPTLPQRDSGDLTGSLRPSKTMVLASAIDYIKAIKAERDSLLEENEGLRGIRPSNVQAAVKLRNYGRRKAT